MTKAELVEEVSRVSDLTKKHSEVIVDTVFKSIVDALHRGEKIELRGFGSFRLRRREPRKGRNPKTGDKVDVPPKKVPYFKPGKELKDLINKAATERPGRIECRSTRSDRLMDRLWTPWRLAYVTERASATPGCIFCEALDARIASDPLVVHRGARAFVILNKFPYNNGHLMVVPNRHVGRLADLDAGELAELMTLTQARRARAARASYAAARLQHGPEPGQAGGRRRARSSAHARRAALERRHEFHVGRRRDAGAARGAAGNGRASARARFRTGSKSARWISR